MSDAGRPLRIGLLAPGYPGGAPGDYRGIFVQQLARQLKLRGHRVCVLTSRIREDDRPFTRVDEAEEVHRFRFWSEGKLLAEYQRIPLARMATYMVAACWTGRRVFGGFGCDLIHTHFLLPTGLVGAALAASFHRPHVLSVHGSDARMAVRNGLMRRLARWTLARSQAVTATATHLLEPLAGLGLREGDATLLPMGIDEIFFKECPPLAERPAGSIISNRTLQEDPYNVSQLIRAMALLAPRRPEVTLTVAGDGPDRARLVELTRELGLADRVRFIGWADPAAMAGLLRAHRLYVSTSRHDGASVSLFEALASGVYPVLSDIAANRAWVGAGETGRLFALGEPAALARALEQALADPVAAACGVLANRQRALESFSWPGVALRLETVYRRALGERVGD